jgi:DNA-directed RNA polymerase subunit RPC12/RpoP
MTDSGFDRLRPRGGPTSGAAPLRVDPLGRQSLYSVSSGQPPAPGVLTISCSSCGERSVVTPRQLLQLALPSLHLPLVRRGYPSWMRCPACDRRTWVKVALTL